MLSYELFSLLSHMYSIIVYTVKISLVEEVIKAILYCITTFLYTIISNHITKQNLKRL